MLYLWIKALHVISVIAWMAGLLYLPRLFVYHVGKEPGGELSETFKVMERRLYRFIMTPAMAAAWIFGLLMLGMAGEAIFTGGWWMAAKLILVLSLSGLHMLLGLHLKAFAADCNGKDARYFRILNEVPALVMVGIVVLVIVRPF
ncbi:MAG: protoporphyrinogen oxidase HemJ [Parvibaculaceae bacterium]